MNLKPKPKHLRGVPPKRKKGERFPHDIGSNDKPTDYRPEYCGALLRYFSEPASWIIHYTDKGTAQVIPQSKLPTFERFAASIGVNRDTLRNWREHWPEWDRAYADAESLQKAFLMELSAAGVGGNGAAFILKCNHGSLKLLAATSRDSKNFHQKAPITNGTRYCPSVSASSK
jgi:hypothetical protein